MSDIAGGHVVITGGASGIGRLMALRLAARGARLTLWDINREALDRVVDEIGAQARGLTCDVADRERVYATAAETTGAGGPVDILINNAGIVSGADFVNLSDAKIQATFAINVLALFWTCKAVLPAMIERNPGPYRDHRVRLSAGRRGAARRL